MENPECCDELDEAVDILVDVESLVSEMIYIIRHPNLCKGIHPVLERAEDFSQSIREIKEQTNEVRKMSK